MDLRFNILMAEGGGNFPVSLTHPDISVIYGLRNYKEENRQFSGILVVFEDSLLKGDFLLSVEMYKKIFDIEILFISDKKELRDIMEKYGEVYPASLESLTYKSLSSIYLKDETTAENLLLNFREHLLGEDFKESPEVRVESLEAKVEDLEDKYNKAKARLEEMMIQRTYELESSRIIESRYKSLLGSVVHNDIVLRQIEHILTKDVYGAVDRGRYKNSPRILYIKEYQDLPYKHSLIQTLAETVRLVLRKSVKVLFLYDSSASREVHYTPSQYLQLYNTYSKSDVYTNDYLIKVGAYKDVLHLLLDNRINLDTLIIVDCKDHTGSVVNTVESNLVLARDKEKTVELGVPPGIIITNNEKDPLHWVYYPECEGLNKDDRFTYLSSRPVIKRFIETWGGS